MPLLIRLWLLLSRVFAPIIHLWARRMHLKHGLSKDRFAERLGRASTSHVKGRWVWFHAASLGEVSQIAKLIAVLQEQEDLNVIVTTVTESGANWVTKMLPSVVHQYLPLDTPIARNSFLDNWSPEMAIFVEADIWPGLVLEAAARRIPLVLLNARPSKSRDRAPKSYRYLLSRFAAITCQSPQVLKGFRTLGIASERLFHFGDLRASVPALPVDPEALSEMQTAIAGRPVWVAASSHADDEAEILEACRHVLEQHPDALLIWAPRHPQRAGNIIEAAAGLVVHQRTKAHPITPDTQIYLADTLGEMGMIFSSSKIVFLGGSFGDEGGHNPFEPACFGCFIITGPHYRNHQGAFSEFMRVGAAVAVSSGAELGALVVKTIALDSASKDAHMGKHLVAAANESAAQTGTLLLTLLRT